MITVDKNVKYANEAGKKGRKYPFSEMEIGDSFFVPVQEKLYSTQMSIGSSGRQYFRGVGMKAKISVLAVTENGVKGYRCWLISKEKIA